MEIKKFIDDCNKTTNEVSRNKVIKGVMNNQILGIAEKIAFAKTVAHRICSNENGKFEFNSVTKVFHFTIECLRKYTSLEIDDNPIESYDLLDSNGLLTLIILCIPEKERDELRELADLALDDYVKNHGNTVSLIMDRANEFIGGLDNMFSNFTDEDKENFAKLLSEKLGDSIE